MHGRVIKCYSYIWYLFPDKLATQQETEESAACLLTACTCGNLIGYIEYFEERTRILNNIQGIHVAEIYTPSILEEH